jgi:predicted small secreted protein
MRKLSFLAATLALVALTGCATVEGVGRDISGGANRVSGWFN